MGGPLHLTYRGWGGQAGRDIRADHLHQAHLPRLLLFGAGGLSQQAAEQVRGEQVVGRGVCQGAPLVQED